RSSSVMMSSCDLAMGFAFRGTGLGPGCPHVHEGESYPRLAIAVNNRLAVARTSVLRRCDRCGRGSARFLLGEPARNAGRESTVRRLAGLRELVVPLSAGVTRGQ
ncbi:MAG: hypothetical protein J7M14_01975, partial [Planctomycetes bacterium]|nr:hypothetical protein [Planctomycetota bacterium]